MEKKFITADVIREVSRTSRPHTVFGWTLRVEALLTDYSRGADWEKGYYILKTAAARRIADMINADKPWAAGEPLVGEIMPPSPKTVALRSRANLKAVG